MSNEKVKAIVRFIVGAILLLNMGLTMTGRNPVPFDETAVTEWLTMGISGLGTIYTWWWKNNNMTKTAQEAQDYKRALAEDGDGSDSQEV